MRVRGMLCTTAVADDAKPPAGCMLVECPPLLLPATVLQNYVSSTPSRFKTKKNFWLTSSMMKDLTFWPSLRHGSRRCMGTLLSPNSVQTVTPPLTDQDLGREVWGVAFMYKNSLQCSSFSSSDYSSFEHLDLLLTIRPHPIHIIIVYRPPVNPLSAFWRSFHNFLTL
jgi:hypothetical protein